MKGLEPFKGVPQLIQDPSYRKQLGLPDKVMESYQLLAQGEYNVNFKWIHPYTHKPLLLRINTGSQIHAKNQIGYEAHALELLKKSGHTPHVWGCWPKDLHRPYGVLVESWLPGHALDYRTECGLGMQILADIHNIRLTTDCGLIVPKDPLVAILEECEDMFSVYVHSSDRNPYTQAHIRSMLDKAWQIQKQNIVPMSYRCCVNTELNNSNFLINGNTKTNYLIDWEKPVYSEPAQDLGHFLAPTTTFWKTDVILDQATIDALLKEYIHAVNGRFCLDGLIERTHTYLSVTCMRGITYCAMAWVQYQQPDRLIYNPETKEKLDRYLDDEFLDWIEANYLTS